MSTSTPAAGSRARGLIVRARQILLLVRPTVRASDWPAALAGSLLAIGVDHFAGLISPPLGMELAAVVLALGVSFALDDPAALTLAATPAPLGLRQMIRAACALPLVAAAWIAILLSSRGVDSGTLTLVLAGFLASAFAIAAVGVRFGESGGLVAAPALLALGAAVFLLPERISLLPVEGPQGNERAFAARWALVLALMAVIGKAASRDPGARRHVTGGD